MKRHISAFLDKYRAAIFTTLMLCFAFIGQAQTYQQMFRYGVEENRTDARLLVGLPADTFPVPSDKQYKIHLAGKGDTLYKWSPLQLRWVLLQASGAATCRNQLITEWSVSWQGTGFNFSIHGGLSDGTGSYQIGCNFYTEDSATVTLDASDDDKERIDVIYLDETGIHVLKGDTAAVGSALKPTINADQIELSFVTISPGATTPTLAQIMVYDNHTGESTVSQIGTTIDADNTTNTFIPPKSVNVTNINDPAGGANIDAIYFDNPNPPAAWNTVNHTGISFAIKLKAVMVNGANLGIQLGSGTEVIIPLVKTNITTYQQITIQLSAFGNYNTSVTRVRFRYIRTGSTANYTGFYLDYIYFVSGLVTSTPSGPAQFTFNLTGHNTSPSSTQQSPGTFNVAPTPGTATDYYGRDGTWKTLPTIPNTIGAVNGRTKVANALQYDGVELFGQDADASNRGWMTSAMFLKLDSTYYITNLGDGDSIAMPVNPFTVGMKSFKGTGGIVIVNTDTTITVDGSGISGGASTDELVYITGNYTVADGVTHVQAVGSGSITLTLPSAASWPGRSITISSPDGVGNFLTLSPAVIYDDVGTTTTVMSENTSWIVTSDGTNWNRTILGYQWTVVTGSGTGENIIVGGVAQPSNGYATTVLKPIRGTGGIVVSTVSDEIVIDGSGVSGGSSFLPVTGTGTATGDVIGDLDGNTLTIEQSGFAWLTLDPTAGSEVASLRAWNTTGTGNQGILVLNATNTSAVATLTSDFDGASQLSRIELATDATTSTATYTAVQHTVAGLVRLNTLGGSGTRVVLTDNDGDLSGSGLGTGVATWWATPSSANLIAAITDETGTGLAVFGNTPTITTPVFSGAVSTTAINQLGTNASGTGYIPYVQSIIVRSDETLSNSSADQNLFTNTSHDVITVQANTTYEFYLTGDLTHGAVSHSIALGFTPTTATVTSIEYNAYAWVTAVGTATASQVSGRFKVTTTSVINLAGANAVETFEARGTITIGNTGGTITPQIKFSADPTGTILLKAGARMHIWPIGNDTFTVQGNIN